MPWLQFFDDDDNLLREYEMTRMAKIMMDPGGTLVLDEGAQDSPTNPRVLLIKSHYAYGKSISDSERDKLLGALKPSLEAADAPAEAAK
jgi:hypothetical protein